MTSDNGAQVDHGGGAYPPPDPKLKDFSSNLPLRGKKTDVYEGGYRVPALVNWPGELPPRKVATPMHAVDWLPTLARLAGAKDRKPPGADRLDGLDGEDVWPLLATGAWNGTDRTFYIVWGTSRNREALRHGDWKIARNGGNAWSLFNLVDDPNEQRDLRSEHPVEFERLFALDEAEREKDAAP